MQALASGPHPSRYLTFDEATTFGVALEDPQAFIAGLKGPVIIDEVQRVPGIARAIKAAVDRQRDSGRFLLTGSASVLLLPAISEALVGRIEIHTLWPFSQGEIDGQREGFLSQLYGGDFSARAMGARGVERATQDLSVAQSEDDLVARLLRGGYPVALQRQAWERRRAWFGSYITTLLQRDVRDLARINGLTAMPRLLALLAARSGALLNYAEISRSLAMPQTTLKRYMALLETTFLIRMLPAWSANLGKRLVKSPKIYFVDTGLLAHTLGLDSRRLLADRGLLGHLLENFVVMELRKQIDAAAISLEMFHFRTDGGQEVDMVLESPGGEVVGIEVKAATTLRSQDLRGLRALRDLLGRRFRRGIVLYLGREPLTFGPDLFALPLPSLWAGD